MEHPRAQQRRWLVVGLLSTLVTGILGYVLAATLVKPEGVTAGPTRGSPLMLGWDLHQSGSEGFALGLPSLWQERRLPADAPNVRFLAVDVEPGLGDFTPVVAISKTDLPSREGLDIFYSASLKAYRSDDPSMKVLKHDDVTLPTGPAIELEYQRVGTGGQMFQHENYFFVHEHVGFVVHFTSAPYQIDEIETILLQSTFDQIIHTFHFLR